MPYIPPTVNTSYRKIDVGRKKLWSENMLARFEAGTFDRIGANLLDWEDRTEFVRKAVEHELAKRERMKAAVERSLAKRPKAKSVANE